MQTEAHPSSSSFEALDDEGSLKTAQDLDRECVHRRVFARLFKTPLTPIQLKRFSVLYRVGRGAMGEVFRAYDPDLDKEVAVKVVAVRRLGETLSDEQRSAYHERLVQEARALAKLNHPNVLRVYEVGRVPPSIYISMEFIEGPCVSDWLVETTRPWRQILHVFRSAGEGLLAAHNAELVHRDFKASNVMLTSGSAPEDSELRACVTDFGLARSISSRDSTDPQSSDGAATDPSHRLTNVEGTIAYMAPEQSLGEVSPHSDQFSFCASLYEALYGQLPFEGITLQEIPQRVAKGPLAPPPDVEIPRWIFRALRRGMQLDPSARYPSMRELLTALDDGRRRRRRAQGLGAGALVAAGLLVGYGIQLPLHEPCMEFAEMSAGVWNDTTREELRAEFAAAGPSTASESLQRIDDEIGPWMNTWLEQRQEACETMHAEAEANVSSEVNRTAACLDQKWRELQQTVEELRRPDQALVEWAPITARHLPRLEECAGPLPPVDPPDKILEVALARAKALISVGRFSEARQVAAELLEQPEEGGVSWYHAWLRILDGQAAIELRDFDEAVAGLEAGAYEAEALRAEYLAWTAWSTLAGTSQDGAVRERWPRWIESADAAARRLEDRPGAERRRHTLAILRANAVVGANVEEWERVEAGLMDALTWSRARVEVDQLTLAALQTRLARAIETEDLEQVKRLMPQVEEAAEALFGAAQSSALAPALLGNALLNIGYGQIKACRWDDALTSLERSLDQWSRLPHGDEVPEEILRVEGAIIQARIGKGDYAAARPYATRALQAGDSMGRASALLSLANVDFGEGRLDEAGEHMEDAAKIFEEQGRPDLRDAVRLGLAETRLHQGRPEEAAAIVETIDEGLRRSPYASLFYKLEGIMALLQGKNTEAAASLRRGRSALSPCELYERADMALLLATALGRVQPNSAEVAALKQEARDAYAKRGHAGEQRHALLMALLDDELMQITGD